jgi:hypothetical protein
MKSGFIEVRLKPDTTSVFDAVNRSVRLQPDRDQLCTQRTGFPVPSSVPLMYQFLPSGS